MDFIHSSDYETEWHTVTLYMQLPLHNIILLKCCTEGGSSFSWTTLRHTCDRCWVHVLNTCTSSPLVSSSSGWRTRYRNGEPEIRNANNSMRIRIVSLGFQSIYKTWWRNISVQHECLILYITGQIDGYIFINTCQILTHLWQVGGVLI